MSRFKEALAAIGIAALCACTQHPTAHIVYSRTGKCADRATNVVAANVAVIAAHEYASASQATESAARIALGCAAKDGSPAGQFGDRWRAANALVVAAELAHRANDIPRAHRLLREGYGVMHALRPPERVSPLTSTLIAQELDSAERDMHGQWAAW